MIGRVRIRRRLAAIAAAVPLTVALALAWQIRPPLPPLPTSWRAPLPLGAGIAVLQLCAWALFVLLDLALWRSVLDHGSRREPTDKELRLRRALQSPQKVAAPERPDWRTFAAPPATPVMRLAALTPTETVPLGPPPVPSRVAARERIERDELVGVESPALARADTRIGVRLLGPLELVGCKKKQPRRKATGELLACLALQQRPVSRGELIETLWPGDQPRRSNERFNQAATEARRLLGDGFQRQRDNTYQLDRHRLSIDLDQLEQFRERAQTATGQEQRVLLEHALALYRGAPFAGIDALWADAEARRLQAIQIELLVQTARLRLQAGDATGALAAAEHASLLDRTNERPVQLAMQAQAALGQRDAVLARYQQFRSDLSEQLGLEPSRETKQLYRNLLSQDGATDPDDEYEHAAR